MKNENNGSPFESPLVSVLVAAYNVENTFEACIRSVVSQTYGNLEVIVVDDGSTDGTPALCDAVAISDPRVSVFHQPNGGLSAARNTGLEHASGDYVVFVDSDDEMMPRMVERLYDIIRETGSDIAFCDWFVNKVKGECPDPRVTVMGPEEFMPQVLTDRITSHAWNKLFKRSIWNGIEFPLGRVVEDMVVMHLVFAKATKVAQTNEKLYLYYAGNPDNLTNTNKLKLASSIDRAFAFESRYAIARESYPEVAEEVFSKLALFKVSAYYKVLCRGDGRDDGLLSWLKNNSEHVRRSGIGGKRKVLAAIAGSPLDELVAWAIARRLEHRRR